VRAPLSYVVMSLSSLSDTRSSPRLRVSINLIPVGYADDAGTEQLSGNSGQRLIDL
jgi:hypothetical protein